MLVGSNETSPRAELIIGDTSAASPNADGKALVGGVIWQSMKLLVGAEDKLFRVAQDVTTGPVWPNSSSHLVPDVHWRLCGREPSNGCLFNLTDDPTESKSVATTNPELFSRMLARIDTMQRSV